MTSPYRHALLDPRQTADAEQANARVLGVATLGVEVTEPALAARCGLGNIDPQHRPGGGAVAAIEAALDWALPPRGSILVTIRPDADAYGAMAVLGLRAAGTFGSAPELARIAALPRADRFDHGAWPGLRPLPADAAEIDEIGVGEQGIGALAAGFADRTLGAEAAVAAMRAWIVAGTIPDAWRTRAAAAAAALFAALAGRVRIEVPEPGGIALIDGAVPGALRLAYRCAPVVVGLDRSARGNPPRPWRRITVAQWSAGFVDPVSVATRLNAAERGWGGSPTIIGSPQAKPCTTPLPRVLAALRECAFDLTQRGSTSV